MALAALGLRKGARFGYEYDLNIPWHFLHETLKAFEKRKYAVAFTLMRKALKYDLMFATWLLADPDDLYAKMASPADLMDDKIQPERRRTLLRAGWQSSTG